MYGDDITTLLTNEANPLARVWAAAQIFPVMKVTKAGKLIKLVKLNTKGIPLSKMLPLKPIRKGFWTSGRPDHPVKNAYNHYKKQVVARKEFPEIQNAKQYVEAAWRFMEHPPKGTISKTLKTGQKVLYHPPSNTILFTKNGMPESMYKPVKGIEWLSEPKNKGTWGGIIR